MIKKVKIPIFFTVFVFILFLGINAINIKNIIKDQTPVKFSSIINNYEDKELNNQKIIIDNLKGNIYRQYNMTSTSVGFIVGTMGYEEEMLVYVELEYISDNSIKVNQVDILYENETDGYGDYVVESWFLDRFKQEIRSKLSLVKRKKTENNQIIAITGATITSEAIVRAVNDCMLIMEDRYDENE